MRSYIIVFVLVQIFDVQPLVVPDEWATAVGIILSHLPILKKGTDSRIGWGFRIGDRADLQIITEFGPQKYTQRLANQEDSNANKRNTVRADMLSNTRYFLKQRDKYLKKRRADILAKLEAQRYTESVHKTDLQT